MREIVALSPQLVAALEARADVEPLFRAPPYAVFRLKDSGPGYVEALAYAPVRSSPHEWREKAYRWFTRKPLSPALLVFSEDARFATAEPDECLPPPLVPLPGGVELSERMEGESLSDRAPAGPAIRCWSRSPITRAGAPTARTGPTSCRPG